jgi:rare lipoprotein A
MRYFVIAALSVMAFGLADARPASAYWQCVGPAVACGGDHASAPKKAWTQGRKGELAQKQRRVASTKAYRAERRRSSGSVVNSGSYGGGGSVGMASYYWQGTRTASGARFNPGGMTAAHKTLPFGTKVLVTHVATGRTVTVTINDRGPFVRGRIIDLSRGAASALGITNAGVAKVSVSVLGRG